MQKQKLDIYNYIIDNQNVDLLQEQIKQLAILDYNAVVIEIQDDSFDATNLPVLIELFAQKQLIVIGVKTKSQSIIEFAKFSNLAIFEEEQNTTEEKIEEPAKEESSTEANIVEKQDTIEEDFKTEDAITKAVEKRDNVISVKDTLLRPIESPVEEEKAEEIIKENIAEETKKEENILEEAKEKDILEQNQEKDILEENKIEDLEKEFDWIAAKEPREEETVEDIVEEKTVEDIVEEETVEDSIEEETLAEVVQDVREEEAEKDTTAETKQEKAVEDIHIEDIKTDSFRQDIITKPVIIRTDVKKSDSLYIKNTNLVILGDLTQFAEVITDQSIYIYGGAYGKIVAGVRDKNAIVFVNFFATKSICINGICCEFNEVPKEYFNQTVVVKVVDNELNFEVLK